jgi:CO/xanthine dehydrogenase Mo-binding subunit
MASASGVTRRDFVRSAAGLVLGFSFAAENADTLFGQSAKSLTRPTSPSTSATGSLRRIDSWLRIAPDGRITVTTGKVEIGMGVNVALAQIVAEELDVPFDQVSIVMGDTSTTPDQGGVGGSNSISSGGAALRNVAATARGLLLAAASRRLKVPVQQLEVRDGIVRVADDPSRFVAYGMLAETTSWDQELNVTGAGVSLEVRGSGRPKDRTSYSIVGQPIARTDIPAKVCGTFSYVGDVRLPDMLHGRVARPPAVGAGVLAVDDTASQMVANFVQTIVRGNFVGVVAETEWGAVKALAALQISWSAPDSAFPSETDLYSYMRSVTPKASRETDKRGDPDAAIERAATRVAASYEYPFHSHATMGPGCAVADVQPNGITTVWCGAQKPHQAQKAFAELIGRPPEKVRVVWVQDSGSYGRPGFDDVAADALVLSQAVGRPVRVQWMRGDMTGWGPKGPAAVFDVVGGLDASGAITGVRFTSRAFSGGEIHFLPTTKSNLLAAQLMGVPNTSGFDEFAEWGGPGGGAAQYAIEHILSTAEVLRPLHPTPSPLACTHLRDPNGPSTSFAVESFLDELAHEARMDPFEFRIRHLTDARSKAVLAAAAEKFGWRTRPSPAPPSNAIARGRGMSLGVRGGTYVGNVAEVEVNRQTGQIRVLKVVLAHDCGLVINPLGLRHTLQANVVQTLSRTLKEEVRFDRRRVTSIDWMSYPIARIGDIPQIEVVIVNRPDVPSTGAGEAATRALAAAVANAVFDATGIRLRRVPFTPQRVKAATAAV